MLRRLRRRPRADALITEKRRATNRAGRTVYLLLLLGLGGAVANFLFGDIVLLRADGLLVRDRSVIAPTYVARVQAVAVREGQAVEAGDILLDLQSAEMLDRLAELSSRRAQLAANAVDLQIRARQVDQLLPLAQRREAETRKTLASFERLAAAGLATASGYDNALTANFSARRDRIGLSTQGEALSDQLAALETARRDAEVALTDLEQHYAGGVVRAPVSGQVGASIPSPGSVYTPGEPILTVFWGQPYVLAYLPRRYVFPIRKGMAVRIADGRRQADGVIDEILAVSEVLPKEFQNAFRPLDRNQLAKIRFTGPAPFPLHQKVRITRPLL